MRPTTEDNKSLERTPDARGKQWGLGSGCGFQLEVPSQSPRGGSGRSRWAATITTQAVCKFSNKLSQYAIVR
jgi:hypothetical protein